VGLGPQHFFLPEHLLRILLGTDLLEDGKCFIQVLMRLVPVSLAAASLVYYIPGKIIALNVKSATNGGNHETGESE